MLLLSSRPFDVGYSEYRNILENALSANEIERRIALNLLIFLKHVKILLKNSYMNILLVSSLIVLVQLSWIDMEIVVDFHIFSQAFCCQFLSYQFLRFLLHTL